MLDLNRKPGEAPGINHSIEVRVVEVRSKSVKLGFSFPAEVAVLRGEVFEAVRQADEAAAGAALVLPGALAPASADVEDETTADR